MAAETKHPDVANAIKHAGSQAELARRCGCAQQTISKMLNGEIGITAELAKKIDEVTEGVVPRWRLRPDLWEPPAPSALSPAPDQISHIVEPQSA